jgi:hypothetical protein
MTQHVLKIDYDTYVIETETQEQTDSLYWVLKNIKHARIDRKDGEEVLTNVKLTSFELRIYFNPMKYEENAK